MGPKRPSPEDENKEPGFLERIQARFSPVNQGIARSTGPTGWKDPKKREDAEKFERGMRGED